MHGVTKPIELNVTTRLGVHPKTNKTIAGFKLSGTLQRSDYKLAPKTPTTILGDEVQITANTEFSKN
jgi:polyisoprenoid-binding protein YceI